MGYLLDTTQPLSYEQTKALAQYIKEHGIIQFLHLYKKFKDMSHDKLFWGDEIELHLVNIDPVTKLPRLQINNEYIFSSFISDTFSLQPEFGAWMLETVPLQPYEFTGDPNILLKNFKERRETLKSLCKGGDKPYAGAVFPMLKVGDFYVPKVGDKTYHHHEEEKDHFVHKDPSTLGKSFKYELLNPHPRYATSCESVHSRRGEKVCMLAPLYIDEKTSIEKTMEEPYPGFIYMDEGLFGTGNASMQVTFGTKNIDEARYLTDQMSVFSSIVLPLSAASAIFKGKLADTDLRWDLLCESTDCRCAEERDPSSANYRPKSRWSSISRYISNRPQCKEEYNDVKCPIEEETVRFAKEKARDLGVEIDDRLLKHIGFLFIQDPLVIYSDKIFVDDSSLTNHFENIQSTNWNNVRFKPPPSFDSDAGWRVELRTMEAQLTADECVAFGMFSYFFALMVMKKEYNFYIPISKVDENFVRAHKRDSVLTQKFWFRKKIEKESPDEWVELTIDEILHGNGSFVGLFNLIYEFCKEEYGVDIKSEWSRKKEDGSLQINKLTENMKYFEILSKRAKGEMPTIANWIRTFVLKHPKYNKDSIVTAEIATDLIDAMMMISDGEKTYTDFL